MSQHLAPVTRAPLALSTVRPGTLLAQFTPEDREIVRAAKAPDASDAELNWFLSVVSGLGFNPLTNDAHLLITETKNRSGQITARKVNIHIGIDGFRKRAMASGRIRGIVGPEYCDASGNWSEVLPDLTSLIAARVRVYLGEWDFPITVVAHWDEFGRINARYYDDGNPKNNWAKMPRWMLGKVALANALRSAVPDLLGGVYTTDELNAEEHGGYTIEVTDQTGAKKSRSVPRPGNAPPPPRPTEAPAAEVTTQQATVVEAEITEPDDTAERTARIAAIKPLFAQVFPGDGKEGVNWELALAYCANLDGAGKLGRVYPMLHEWTFEELATLESALADEWARKALEPKPEPEPETEEPTNPVEPTEVPAAEVAREELEEKQAAAALGNPEVPEAAF